jgi:hypothetical protein
VLIEEAIFRCEGVPDKRVPLPERNITEAPRARIRRGLFGQAFELIKELDDSIHFWGDGNGRGRQSVMLGVPEFIRLGVERGNRGVEVEDKPSDEIVGRRGEKLGDIIMYVDSFDGNGEGMARKVDRLRGRRCEGHR